MSIIKSASLLAAAAFAAMVIAAPGSAAISKTHKAAASASATTWPQICPMSGEKIASAKDAVGKSVYKGKTYYFCCPMCKPQFDKNPAKYSALAAKHKYSLTM
jgi:YHS domain-containing protein